MKNKVISGLIIASLASVNLLNAGEANAFWGKDSKKEEVKKLKVEKAKSKNWTKLKVTNKFDYINLSWWDSFSDDYLFDYITRAVDHNNNVKIASLTVDEYFQNVKAQRAGELPTIAGGFIPGYGGTDSLSNGAMMFPIFVNYEADIFLKNHDKTKAVKKSYEASIQDERAAYISVVSAVGSTYFNIIQLDKLIENQTLLVELKKEIYETTIVSQEEGVASASDVIMVQKAFNTAQATLFDLEKSRLVALNQMAVLIGESPSNISSFERSKFEDITYKFDIPEEVSSEVITHRPDYLKAEIMLQKSGIDVRVAKKEFLPAINIGGLALFNVLNPAGGMLPNFLWGVGGGVFQSLFTGGAKMANLKINKVRYEKMFKTYQNTNLVSIQEVNDALFNCKYNNEKYGQNFHNLELETKDFELSNKLYDEGILSKLELNQKEESFIGINNIVVQNRIACIIDSIGYYKSTGANL